MDLPARPSVTGRVSPDGSYVVAAVYVSPYEQALMGISFDGRALWTAAMAGPGLPAPSPDGKKVAVTADRRVMVYDVSTASLKALGVEGDNPAWSSDNTRLAYEHNANVYVYDFEGNVAAEIGQGTEPSWSPDGERVAVRAGRHRVEWLNVHTRARAPLLEATGVSVPLWSPNGEWMMYSVRGRGRW